MFFDMLSIITSLSTSCTLIIRFKPTSCLLFSVDQKLADGVYVLDESTN
jgi:hypothetical protein